MKITAILFLLFSFAFSSLVIAKTSVALDKIETIRLSMEGPTNVEIYAPQTGLLRADVFSVSGIAGPVRIEYQAEKPEAEGADVPLVPVGNKVVNKGKYSVNIWAENNEAGQVQIRFVLDPALDIYEPNNVLESAKLVSTPYLGLIRVSKGDEDWFKVDVPNGDVIGVQLRTRSEYTGPEISFHNASGDTLYGSSKDNWGHRGMRYYRSEGKPVFVKIIDSYKWRVDDARAFRQLVIEAYPPNRNGTNLFVKIDMNASENSAAQIDFISDAAGGKIASAAEADEISSALKEAVRADEPSFNIEVVIGLTSLIALLGLGWLYRRRQKTKIEIKASHQS